jgi:8-oxo-dGTP diphosphatase
MTTLGAFAMVFDDIGRILCVRMNYANRNWTTPGGRVEKGESPIVALKRETLEESGYEIDVGDLIGVYSKTYADDLVLCFEGRVLSRSYWSANEEISEIRWFSRTELPDEMSLVVRTRIGDAFDGARGVFRVFDVLGSDDM